MKLLRLVLPTVLSLIGVAWIIMSHFDSGSEREHHFIYGLLFLILSFLFVDRKEK